ncbi:hypothetical protein J6590_077147 [Homalodisca vitripennis]|nr:hypothetical protein J6590_077147 [Homalodisca vitripennis]
MNCWRKQENNHWRIDVSSAGVAVTRSLKVSEIIPVTVSDYYCTRPHAEEPTVVLPLLSRRWTVLRPLSSDSDTVSPGWRTSGWREAEAPARGPLPSVCSVFGCESLCPATRYLLPATR